MQRTITTAGALVETGLLPGERLAEAEAVAARYAIGLTPAMARLIETADDPIGLQFLPQGRELMTLPGERNDPIGDHAHSPVEGIVHRYPDRVLIKALHVCPLYCRFCFRREMVGPDGDGTLTAEKLDAAIAYIRSNKAIWEVIVTGGDPLMMSPRRLGDLMERLGAISHVKIVRFHSRVPAVDPERINDALLAALSASGKTVYVALHANHPREMTPACREALAQLGRAGIVLLSQTVLLKGVNDSPEVLAELMRAFVENSVVPYYLHHPDLAPGTGHFRLTIGEGRHIVSQLRGRLSGLCQPTYVLDIPGGHGKVDLESGAVFSNDDGSWTVTDFRGVRHTYPNQA